MSQVVGNLEKLVDTKGFDFGQVVDNQENLVHIREKWVHTMDYLKLVVETLDYLMQESAVKHLATLAIQLVFQAMLARHQTSG